MNIMFGSSIRTVLVHQAQRAFLLLFVMTFFSCGFVERKPQISVDSTTIDLGRLHAGEVRSASITITNTGSASLMISDISTSCGCTKVNSPSMTLAPGRSDTLVVSFNSQGFSGKTTKRVTITSNDELNKETVVTLVAEVVEELKLISHPGGIVNLGKLERGKTHRETITVQNTTTEVIRVQSASSSGKTIGVDMKPAAVQPHDSLNIVVTVTPETVGIRQEIISLRTDSKNQPKASIRVVYSS